MHAIQLEPILAEQISYFIGNDENELKAAVDKAMRSYIGKLRQAKIEKELTAFKQQHDALRTQYEGDYVAIHEGEVIEHDSDLRTLHLRVIERFGTIPVLLKKVDSTTERVMTIQPKKLVVM